MQLGKWKAFFENIVATATTLEQVTWKSLEESMTIEIEEQFKKPQLQITLCASKKFAETQLDVSILVLIKYMTKYKQFDFRAGVEERINCILQEMGIEEEKTETSTVVRKIATAAVMSDCDAAGITDICVVAGFGETKDDDSCWDARMIFSNFINRFFEKRKCR